MSVPGLSIYYEKINEALERDLIADIDSKDWDLRLSRRTQHYGFRYSYSRNRRVMPVGTEDLPGLYHMNESININHINDYLRNDLYIDTDQCIVNDYKYKQGIGAHTDDEALFGDTIVTISLLSSTTMKFRSKDGVNVVDIELPPRSMAILQGAARYDYTHEIPNRLTYIKDGRRTRKNSDYRRISVTYRKVIALSVN